MIFDTLCSMAERHLGEAVPLLRKAHLFEFPGDAHGTLPVDMDEETAALLSETFFLPFPVVAVEDPVSCVVLFDAKPDQEGLDSRRYFAECLPLDRKHLSRAADAEEKSARMDEVLASMPVDAVQIAFGRIEIIKVKATTDPKETQPFEIQGWVDRLVLCNKRKVYANETTLLRDFGEAAPAVRSVLRNVKTAFEELFYFNTPNRFVVERTELQERAQQPGLKVLRSSHRPRYILLTPHEIRETLGMPGDGASPAAHYRRKHYRRLLSERYREARGKLLCIPATWVGPDEVLRKRTRYKVRLDL